MKARKNLILAALLCAGSMIAAVPTCHGSIVFQSAGPYSGYTLDATGWLTVTVDDVPNGVEFSMALSPLANAEYFIREIAFNSTVIDGINPPGVIEITESAAPPTISSVSAGPNVYAADGAGRFDLRIIFAQGAERQLFGPGDDITFTLTSQEGAPITAASLLSFSAPTDLPPDRRSPGGNLMSVLFRRTDWVQPPQGQSVEGDQFASGTVVPEPATFLAGALLLLPFGVSAFRMFRQKGA